jgi:uncharacterized membrane protein
MANSSTGRTRKSFLLRGVIRLLPAVLTIAVLTVVVQFVNRYVTSPVNAGLYWSLERNALGWDVLGSIDIDPNDINFVDADLLPGELQDLARREGTVSATFQQRLTEYRETEAGFFRNLHTLAIDPVKLRAAVTGRVHPLVGVGISLLLVIVVSWLAGGFLGRRMISSLDRTLQSVPIVRSVHPYTKQLVDFFLSDQGPEFENVVALQFFNPGIWSIGFVTGPGMKTVREKIGRRTLSVFLPSSPVPMTGYTAFVDADEVVPLSISVDDAIRVVVSGGVLIPPAESLQELERQLRDNLDTEPPPETA